VRGCTALLVNFLRNFIENSVEGTKAGLGDYWSYVPDVQIQMRSDDEAEKIMTLYNTGREGGTFRFSVGEGGISIKKK
jgi:hypothetical protein